MSENKPIDCMAQHIKAFHEQTEKERRADFAAPCETCPYKENCTFNWLSIMEPLLSQSSVQINMACLEH